MTGTLARLVRVRHVQHALAVAESLSAQAEANSIAHNATRLARVRADLFRQEGVTMGSNFAAYRELADRLERAGRQLDGALYDARRKVDEKQDLRSIANREKETYFRCSCLAQGQRFNCADVSI